MRGKRLRVWAHIRWELLDVWRRVSVHPLTVTLLVLGLPAILAAYALFGHMVSEVLLEAWEIGPTEYAEQLTRAARVFAVLLVLMGSGGVIGNLFHARPREMLARHRPLPLSDFELWLARRFWEDGAFLVLVIFPMFGVAAARMLTSGVDPFLAGVTFAAPLLLGTICLVLVRVLVLLGILLCPRRFLSWRAAIWLLIFAVVFAVRPAAAAAHEVWSTSEEMVFPLTDWVGGIAYAWLNDERGTALQLLLGAVALSIAAIWLDYTVFRSIVLRRFDEVHARLNRPVLSTGGVDVLGALLDRLPDSALGLPLRGLVKKDALRIARDPVLSLTIQVPVLVVALSAAFAEVTAVGLRPAGSLPVELGVITRLATFGVLGVLLTLGGASQAVLSIAWEGDRLGPVRACPLGDRRLWEAKARSAGILCALPWLAVYAAFYIWTGPWPGVPTWCAALALPAGIALAGMAIGRTGAAAGAIFALPRARNPLLAVGLPGLGVQFLLATTALCATALAILAPLFLGPVLLYLGPVLLVVWLLAIPVMRDEGVRSVRRIRAR